MVGMGVVSAPFSSTTKIRTPKQIIGALTLMRLYIYIHILVVYYVHELARHLSICPWATTRLCVCECLRAYIVCGTRVRKNDERVLLSSIYIYIYIYVFIYLCIINPIWLKNGIIM